jgi:hypothetical protein
MNPYREANKALAPAPSKLPSPWELMAAGLIPAVSRRTR